MSFCAGNGLAVTRHLQLIQLTVPEGLLGRINGLLNAAEAAAFVTAFVLAGVAVTLLGVRATFGISAAGVFVALVLVALLREIPAAFTRVGVGVLLAFALDPVVNRVRHRLHCSRATAVALVGSVAVALVAFLIVVLGPSMMNSSSARSMVRMQRSRRERWTSNLPIIES